MNLDDYQRQERRTQHSGEEQDAQDSDSNAGRLQKNTTENAKAAARDEDLEPKEKEKSILGDENIEIDKENSSNAPTDVGAAAVLEVALNQKLSEIEALRNELGKINEEIRTFLQTEKEKLERKREELQRDCVKLSKENKELEEKWRDLDRVDTTHFNLYEDKIENLEKKVSAIQSQVDEIEELVNDGNTDCEEISQRQEEMKRDVNSLIERTRKQIDEALHSINELEKKKEALDKEMKVLVTDLVKDYNEKNLQTTISEIVDGNDDSEIWHEVQNIESQIAIIATNMDDMITLTDDYKERFSGVKNAIRELRGRTFTL